MTRLPQYLAYHRESKRIGDIDPSHALLLYVCDRFELNIEQRYWLAFLYAMTYCGASVFYVYNEAPDFENVDLGRLQRWWSSGGRQNIICQTDRRWVRSSNMFVPAVKSYQQWVGDTVPGHAQDYHFGELTLNLDTPEARYDQIFNSAKVLYSFGQFALFLYLEALDTITPFELVPTDLDLSKAWSCRNGLMYAYGLDQHITERELPTPATAREDVAVAWVDVRARLAELDPTTNVWNIETTLCAYRKFQDGKRYIGSYLDRQAVEIAKMQDHVRDGVAWNVLWQFRDETYPHEWLVEKHLPQGRLIKGLPPEWKYKQERRTREILENANSPSHA